MSRFPLCLLAPLFLVACGTQAPDAPLSDDEMVALRSSIVALDPVREELPIEDVALEELGIEFVDEAIFEATCAREGIVSGVWYEVALAKFEGSWFQHGSGDLGGTVDGLYGEQGFDGVATGEGVEVTLTGSYADGLLLGTWSGTDGEGIAREGELIGRYERRNDIGGYFFGVWSRCN